MSNSDQTMQAVIFEALKESVSPVFEKVLTETLEKRSSYHPRKTLIEEFLHDAIADEVRRAVLALVNERRDEIQAAARAAFEGQRDTIVDQFIAKATESLTANVVVSLTVDEKRWRE